MHSQKLDSREKAKQMEKKIVENYFYNNTQHIRINNLN